MSGSFVGIGITVQYNERDGIMLVMSVMEESAAEEAGLLAGDKIVAIDGKSLSELGYEGAVSAIRGEIGTDVTVSVERGTERLDLTATRRQITEKTVTYSIDEKKIGYIKLTGFKSNTAEQFRDAIDTVEESGCVGIVFDLRNNPGGYLNAVVDVIDYLVPDGTRIASYNDRDGESVFTADDGHEINLPIAVIFNQATASAGELFSAAMRDYGEMGILDTVSVGVTTYAKGVMQSTVSFMDGSTLTLTIAYYNPPSDVNYDGVGVIPDIEVTDSETWDAQLEAAYSAINQKISQLN
jgi:carboxyl-terminal processing protease